MPVGFVGPALQGASLLSRFGIPLLQSAGISAGTAGIGALINAAAQTPSNTPSPNRRANVGRNRYSGVIGSIPPSTNGESYRRAELRLADAARPGGGGGGGGNAGYSVPNFRPLGGTPEERAQAAEASRIAQLTAQDPELKRYEEARLKAVAPGATPEQIQSAEDIGMQIWRQKYGATPMGQTGGAVGSFNPLMDRTFGYQAGMAPDQLAEMQRTAAPIPVAPGAVPYQQGDLGTRATLETGYDPAAYGLTPEKIEEMKQKLLQQASK